MQAGVGSFDECKQAKLIGPFDECKKADPLLLRARWRPRSRPCAAPPLSQHCAPLASPAAPLRLPAAAAPPPAFNCVPFKNGTFAILLFYTLDCLLTPAAPRLPLATPSPSILEPPSPLPPLFYTLDCLQPLDFHQPMHLLLQPLHLPLKIVSLGRTRLRPRLSFVLVLVQQFWLLFHVQRMHKPSTANPRFFKHTRRALSFECQ